MSLFGKISWKTANCVDQTKHTCSAAHHNTGCLIELLLKILVDLRKIDEMCD